MTWFIVACLIVPPILCVLATFESNRLQRKALREREQAVYEAELDLGRLAHDINTQIRLTLNQADDDTIISLIDWDW